MTAFKRCETLLKTHSDSLEALARYLIKYEKINGADFDKLMKGELTDSNINETTGENA